MTLTYHCNACDEDFEADGIIDTDCPHCGSDDTEVVD